MGETLARRLQDVGDPASAAEALAENLLASEDVQAVRVWLRLPADRCASCLHAQTCEPRGSCLHLAGSLGTFEQPVLQVERVPLTDALRSLPSGVHRMDLPQVRGPKPQGSEGDVRGIVVPLIAGGAPLGLLALWTATKSSPDLDRIETAATLTAATLRHLALDERERQRHHQIGLLNGLARKVGTILNDDLLLRQAVQDVRRTFAFPDVMVFLRDGDGASFTLRARASDAAGSALVGRRVGATEGIVGRAARTGKTIVVEDVQHDPDFVPWSPQTRSEIAVPIRLRDEVEGVVNVESENVGAFGPTERLVLETVANQLAIALENAHLFSMVREREDRYRSLVEANPGAVFHLAPDGSIVFQNPAGRRLTGQAEAEAETAAHRLASNVVEEDRGRLEEAVGLALEGVPQEEVKLRLRHVDGSPRWVDASFQPIPDEEGRPSGVLVLARDLSREKELQEKLYQAEKLGAVGGLVSGVAHELNNPLAGILGFSQLLLTAPRDTWARDDIEKIEQNARRCQGIVASLLQFARQARIHKQPAHLNEVIESVLKLNEYSLRMDGVRIEKSYDPRLPMIDLDANRWQQVVINLASNAQQAIAEANGDGEQVIRFETRLGEGEAILLIEDTGPGIPASIRSRLFEPFFTTKDTGTGLGLSICHGIVREHGGTLELDPDYESGTRFVIRLPLDAKENTTVRAPIRATTPEPNPPSGGRVLVLDDEPAVLDVVRKWLGRHGFEVTTCERGDEALEHLEDIEPDVLLIDVALGGEMDGLEFHQRLTLIHPELAKRVVFVTGYSSHEGLRRELERRGTPCLAKPFDLHDLLDWVRKTVAGREEPEGVRG